MHTVIIGSGIAGITFAETLLKLKPDERITVVTQETHGYYSRPMLSHGFSRDDVESKIILKRFAALQETGMAILDATEALEITPAAKTLTIRRGAVVDTLAYDKLVVASGSEAFIPPAFRSESNPAWVVNSLDDLIHLRRHRASVRSSGRIPRWAMIGGGLIGCEVAADLAKSGDQVVLFHALSRLMERQLEEDDSSRLAAVMASQGITLRLSAAVRGFTRSGEQYSVVLENETLEHFDGVIIACGFRPRIDLAVRAGLATGRGIKVDGFLTTSDPAIHAIGDVAECENGSLYAYVMPVRHQANWLAHYLAGETMMPWQVPSFAPRAKVHGFEPQHSCRIG